MSSMAMSSAEHTITRPRRFEPRRTRLVPTSLDGLLNGRTSSVALSRAAVATSGLLTVILTSRLLSPSARGTFAALQAAVTIMAVAGSASLWLGISVLLPKIPGGRRAALTLSVVWPLTLSGLLLVVLLATGVPGGVATGSGALAFVVASLVGMSYSNLQGVAIGLNRMRVYSRAEVLRAASAIALVGVGLAAGARSAPALILLWGFGSWCLAGIYLVAVCRPYARAPAVGFVRAAVGRSLRIHPNSVVWLGIQRLDIVVLAGLSSHAQVAYYSLAVAISEGVWLVPGAVAITGLADYPRLDARQATAAVERNLRRTFAASVPTALVLVAAATVLIVVVLPNAYGASILPLIVCVLGTTLVSVSQAISPWIAATLDRPGISSLIAVSTLALDMTLLVLLAPHGALGAAIASTLAYAGASVLYLVVFLRYRHHGPAHAVHHD